MFFTGKTSTFVNTRVQWYSKISEVRSKILIVLVGMKHDLVDTHQPAKDPQLSVHGGLDLVTLTSLSVQLTRHLCHVGQQNISICKERYW